MSFCVECGDEIPDDSTNRQAPGMEPEYCKSCDTDGPDFSHDEEVENASD